MLDPTRFVYAAKAPFEFLNRSERIRDNAIIQDITYASPAGGKASAYLIFSSQVPSRAGLIFGHWGEGNREEFIEEALVLAQQGFVSLCLDAPFRRPAAYEPRLSEPSEAEVQWIVDVRRGVALLVERFELSPQSIGYIGHSFGATYGGVIAGIELRIKASVLIAGW